MEFNAASLAELPFYNADVEQRGFPVAVEGFRKKVADADALIFAVPEYNFSVPGVLKNALEWLSRPPGPPRQALRSVRRICQSAWHGAGAVSLPSHLCVVEYDPAEFTACRHNECQN